MAFRVAKRVLAEAQVEPLPKRIGRHLMQWRRSIDGSSSSE